MLNGITLDKKYRIKTRRQESFPSKESFKWKSN